MAYVRLNGSGTAFGWISDGKITVGGLRPETDHWLIGEEERLPIHTDAQGAWTGRLLHDVVLCVAWKEQPVLWNESRVNAAAAAAMLTPRGKPVLKETPVSREEDPGSLPLAEAQPVADNPAEEQVVKYRQPSDKEPVDCLPEMIWPRAAARLKPYFESQLPIRLFDAPGWRVVKANEAGMPCCFGFRAENDRVREVLYGVRARGGMVPPRGLEGYRYERALDGSGYWVLRQPV